MTHHLPDDDLRRAARSVARLSGYLVAHREWTVAAGSRNALEATHRAADRLRGWLCDTYPEVAAARPPEQEAPARPTGVLEHQRLAPLAIFLEQLEAWFRSRAGYQLTAEGAAILADMTGWLHGAVAATRDQLAAGADPETKAPMDRPDLEKPADAPERLVLEDTEETPLLQEFKGTVELTAEALDLVRGFLDAYGVQMPESSRRQLDHKVQRWLEATPDGHLLVLKMTTLHGHYEPYPVYVARPDEPVTSPA